MKKRNYLISTKKLEIVKNWLVNHYGIPELTKQMAIYFSTRDGGGEIHVRFRNKKCVVNYVRPELDEVEKPRVEVVNSGGVKSLFRLLGFLGCKRGTLGRVDSYNFCESRNTSVWLSLATFVGDLLVVVYEDEDRVGDLFRFLKSVGINPAVRTTIARLVREANIKKEVILDDLGVLNEKLIDYCLATGMEMRSGNSTLRSRLERATNDYSAVENAFKFITGQEMLGRIPLKKTSYFLPLSIIIPCFNSGSTYIKTLASIASQDLPKEKMEEIEVMLIDDGSRIPVEQVLCRSADLPFKCRIIRLEKNSGLSWARNVGLSLASHRAVLFLDSDVVLSKSYLNEHSVRNQLVPNAIFVSFKQNVEPKDLLVGLRRIRRGLPCPDVSSDARVRRVVRKSALGLYPMRQTELLEILGDTNYFKKFSYGRNFGIYDLATMVVGHNLSCRKSNIFECGGFSTRFKGWGMEDSFFGAQMISKGNFIVPVISCGVYHIDHLPRSGSEKLKTAEFKTNLRVYEEVLDQAPSENEAVTSLF